MRLIIIILAAIIIAISIKKREVPKGILEWIILIAAVMLILR